MDALERYILEHIDPEDALLQELDRETHLRMIQPRMISGHLQGRLLEMIVRMIGAQRVLEIGTFTGYSAICMAKGLNEGGVVHTIEIDETKSNLSTVRGLVNFSPFAEKQGRKQVRTHRILVVSLVLLGLIVIGLAVLVFKLLKVF